MWVQIWIRILFRIQLFTSVDPDPAPNQKDANLRIGAQF
jgi:hypothetical protein